MAKYVPPSKRAGYQPPSATDLPPSSILPRGHASRTRRVGCLESALHELSVHFTHPRESTLTFFSYPDPRWSSVQASPLPWDPHGTAEETPLPPSPPPPTPAHPLRHILSYIMLFTNAHPYWETAGELWIHTNAEILRADWGEGDKQGQGDRKNFGRPVPVSHADRVWGQHGFSGWWILDSLEVIPPHSDELRNMIQAKEEAKSYNREGRFADAWREAFSETWIKIHLAPAPPSGPFCPGLKHPMQLKGGEGGEVAKYLLEIGGLTEELMVLEKTSKEGEQEIEVIEWTDL